MTTQSYPEQSCTACGADLAFVDMLALARQIARLAEDDCATSNPGPEWVEVHLLDDSEAVRMQLREHTRERCGRRLAGDPEPVEWDTADEDGDDW